MKQFTIHGPACLQGKVKIGGAKNAVLPLLAASVLAEGPVILDNVPNVSDVRFLLEALQEAGCLIEQMGKHTLLIDPRGVHTCSIHSEAAGRMRASYYLLGAFLGKYQEALVPMPGGCNLGSRPIDAHIKGFESLGCTINVEYGAIHALAPHGLQGRRIVMDVVSVGATINIMLAAVRASGTTEIINAAREPHVVDTANMLRCMGAKISGAGSGCIVIEGVDHLEGCSYSVMPDQIEAATFMAAAAATGGDILLENVCCQDLEAVSSKLEEAGCQIERMDTSLHITAPSVLRAVQIRTAAHPGFPTDAQPQLAAALLNTAPGEISFIEETVFSNRFGYIDQLERFGARTRCSKQTAAVYGSHPLSGALAYACDLRAGAALIIAALQSYGLSYIRNAHYILRGYEDFAEKLQALGAEVYLEELPSSFSSLSNEIRDTFRAL